MCGCVGVGTCVCVCESRLLFVTHSHLVQIPESWVNPTGEWRVGAKALYQLFPTELIQRLNVSHCIGWSMGGARIGWYVNACILLCHTATYVYVLCVEFSICSVPMKPWVFMYIHYTYIQYICTYIHLCKYVHSSLVRVYA